ncbi:MAG: hypothetical protein NUV80_03840 [Candidatus Berkelbacteria bacterium]|nr:hypothetical protein [Candidatus Berkelbacteria bacterium]
MTEDELKKALHDVLDERARTYEERHDKHHEFIDILIAEKRAKVMRMEKIKTHIIGWSVITGISGAGYAIWVGVKTLLISHQ